MSASHDISFLDDLNPVQRAAVTDIEGPSLIVAGAGSGKTRVLTYKIAYLLSQGVRPWHILALTFTNKAAREMRSRIAKLVGEDKARQLNMGTFHSVFAGILRREAVAIGYTPDYTIYDTQDSKSLLKSLCKEMQLDEKIYKPSAVLSRISLAKNRLLSPQLYAADTDIMQQDKTARMYRMPEIYNLYQQRLRSANAMDFDDLLVNTFLLLNQNQQIRERYQQHYQYLLVDEYQDTNHVQYMIIRLLAAPDNRISVVGDDAQSIYSFRGAEIENILGYKNDFQDAHLYKLEQNYRSTKNIVGAANSLIAKNQAQIHKNLFSDGDMGECISIQAYESDRQEASSVAQSIAGKNKRHTSLDDMAVLYRTNAQSRTLEDELRKRGIAYRIYGGLAFYHRKEVKDMLAYLRLCSNLRDEESLLRIINLPARGIGDTTMKKVAEAAHALQKPVFEVVKDPVGNGVVVTSSTKKRLVEFASMVLGWRDKMQQLNAMEFADMVMRESQLMAAAMTDISVEGRDRHENMKELLNSISEFVQREQTEGSGAVTLQDFLTEVSLMTDQDQKIDDSQPRVTLMTVHAAKGLEFPVVYIVGMENNLFPSPYADTLKATEEERRLFYVAITRAKEQCYISYSKTRYINGKMQMQSESSFLRDLDARYVKRIDSTSGNSPFFSGWDSWNEIAQPSRPATRFQTPDTKQSGQHSEKNLRPITSSVAGDQQDIATDFPVDSYVIHKTFGRGRVLRTYKEYDNEKIDILFDTAGQKTLLLKFARLQHCQ